LESRVENNSPYSTLWLCFENGWLTRWSIDLLMNFTNTNWSLKLKTILCTPYYDFVLRMNDWPDGVLVLQWDSRKQLESRIENNSPYSTLWFCFENEWLTRWSIDLLMRFAKIIGVSNCKQFSVLHIMTMFWKWMTDQMEYRFADEIRESNWSHELKTILRTPYCNLIFENGWLTWWSVDLLMRFTKTIGVSNWKQFSVLHVMNLLWEWMTDQTECWSVNALLQNNWSPDLRTILLTP
jgi:hypothetical protein